MTASVRSDSQPSNSRRTDKRAHRALVLRYLRPERGRVAALSLLLLVAIGLQLSIPLLVRRFIDDAVAGATTADLLPLALAFLAAALCNEALGAGTTYLGQDLRWRTTNRLRADLTRHCLRLDMPFHNEQTPGKMIERIDGDVTALSNLMSDYALRIFGNVLLLLGVLVLLARESWILGAAFSVFVLVTLVSLRRVLGVAVPRWEEARDVMAELFGFLEERLAGTEDIRAGGARPWVMQRFHDLLRGALEVRRRAHLYGATMWTTTIALFTVGTILAFALGSWLYLAGSITIGTVYLIFHYTELLRRPLEQLTDQLEDLQRAAGGLERVIRLLAEEPRLREAPPPPSTIPAGALSVEIEHLRFGYQPEDPVIHDLSLSLAPGRVLGLLGRTGSGKSTLARLLVRLYDADAGAVRLGGVDLRAADLAQARRRVGIVTQDVQLFNASLRDNLTFFDPSIPDARLRRVIDEIGLGDWYATLPDGLDSELAHGGGGLSAGEAQLLAFTRVFLQDPGLVLLDEASSRLDPATEQLIERAVDRLLEGRTGIIIAHRLGTVQRADDILILQDGRVLEQGRRAALAADPGSRFSALLATGLEEVLA